MNEAKYKNPSKDAEIKIISRKWTHASLLFLPQNQQIWNPQ
jgi:hypothetical protein